MNRLKVRTKEKHSKSSGLSEKERIKSQGKTISQLLDKTSKLEHIVDAKNDLILSVTVELDAIKLEQLTTQTTLEAAECELEKTKSMHQTALDSMRRLNYEICDLDKSIERYKRTCEERQRSIDTLHERLRDTEVALERERNKPLWKKVFNV